MKIEFKKCNLLGEGFFADMANYKTVDKYLEAVIDSLQAAPDIEPSGKPEFIPLDCAYKCADSENYYWIIKNGFVTEDSKDNVSWLKKLPKRLRQFMSDNIFIQGDGFEKELFIQWD